MMKLFMMVGVCLSLQYAGFADGASTYIPEAGSDAEMKKGPWALKPDPQLPNVLILGDSISIGYTLTVRKLLSGKANVFRPCSSNGGKPVNCQGTIFGVANIDRLLAGQKWDVIHFNWGLHDLKHVKASTNGKTQNSNSFDDPRQAEPDAYKANLSQIVDKLVARGAKLIFGTTTPYPEGVKPARLPADAERYNQIALKIMKENKIAVNDLYTHVEDRLDELQNPVNVHFNSKGNTVLAGHVADAIEKALSTGAALQPDRSVVYKHASGVDLNLHVFEPKGWKVSDQRSAAVFFFGGGWSGGDPKQFYQHARAFTDRGMVAFSAEYRVKGRNKTTPFECVKDGKSAIRWVRAHAAELGVDPARIVASGGSAGGHVAACTGTIIGQEEQGDDLAVSSEPNLMILFNPVLDTTKLGYGDKRFSAEQKTTLSPCHHVRKGIVPTMVFHGTKDGTVPFENAERFTRLMTEVGNTCILVPFEGKGHGFFNGSGFRKGSNDVDYTRTIKHSLSFLEEHAFVEKKK